MSPSPFPAFPVSQITIPSNPVIKAAYTYVKENCSECTLNHVLRSTAFGLIIQKKFPPFAGIDTEAVVISTILHDMGWATTKSLISSDKRFEVDGANIARDFIGKEGDGSQWDKHRIQLLWDAIALHTTPSIAQYKEPEVAATGLGVMGDFFGPNIPLPGNIITVEEYKEVVGAFPRLDFKEELKGIMCGLCREKPETTYDNFVSEYGKTYGLDGKGTGKEEFAKQCEQRNFVIGFQASLDALAQYEN
ncbi:hypothetical protein H2200_000323 [Cladophialophora chaetospira]|uniref:HD domain-containing protein n=1 Tax=Cladophialophora chaetospira TaxID=386627 RepID=A0AA38XP91_9EURO|nr:hypothetical protein H2200_000323 [Cladophialophora chaetospira]